MTSAMTHAPMKIAVPSVPTIRGEGVTAETLHDAHRRNKVMKRIKHMVTISLMCLSLSIIGTDLSQAQQHLTISSMQTSIRGIIFNEILTEAYQNIGMTISIKPYPAQRGLVYANDGVTDGEAGRLETIEQQYPNLLKVPIPIFVNKTTAFTKNPTITIENWEDMRPYHITIMIGLKHTETMLQGFDHVESVATIQQAFKKLEAGRADIVVFALFDGMNILNELGLKEIRAQSFEEIPSYHFIHKKHREILPAITEALKEMEQTGRLQDIASRFQQALEGGRVFDVPRQ